MPETKLADLLSRATNRLIESTQSLSEEAIAEVTALPGWSRGHLLTHLAGNAEGLTRLILGAHTGRPLSMYSPGVARDADIEAGASRPGSVIVSHLHLATATFDAAISLVPDWKANAVFSTVRGAVERPLIEVLRMRLREVAIHHVDLRVAHSFDSEDPDVVAELIRDAAQRMSTQSELRIELLVDGFAVAAIDPRSPSETVVVDLPSPAMLGWLTGRTAASPDLPQLPAWG